MGGLGPRWEEKKARWGVSGIVEPASPFYGDCPLYPCGDRAARGPLDMPRGWPPWRSQVGPTSPDWALPLVGGAVSQSGHAGSCRTRSFPVSGSGDGSFPSGLLCPLVGPCGSLAPGTFWDEGPLPLGLEKPLFHPVRPGVKMT